MTEIRVSKIEAAKRQIELSIRLLFQNEDPIGILTLAAAGFRILRDLGEEADAKAHHHLKKIIKVGMEGKLWKAFNRPADFLKHAENVHDGILDNIQEEANDVLILFACFYYKDLGHRWTLQMVAFITWYMLLHPEIIELLLEDPTKYDIVADDEITVLKEKPRYEQLTFGKIITDRVYIAIKPI
jgi:hypothetical protein